jgi:hypothetical protein
VEAPRSSEAATQSPAHNFAPLTTPTSLQLDDKDYQVPFRFNGKIDKVSVKLGPDQLLPAERRAAQDVKNKVNK